MQNGTKLFNRVVIWLYKKKSDYCYSSKFMFTILCRSLILVLQIPLSAATMFDLLYEQFVRHKVISSENIIQAKSN